MIFNHKRKNNMLSRRFISLMSLFFIFSMLSSQVFANTQYTSQDNTQGGSYQEIEFSLSVSPAVLRVGESCTVSALMRDADGNPINSQIAFSTSGVQGEWSDDASASAISGFQSRVFHPTTTGVGKIEADLIHHGNVYHATRYIVVLEQQQGKTEENAENQYETHEQYETHNQHETQEQTHQTYDTTNQKNEEVATGTTTQTPEQQADRAQIKDAPQYTVVPELDMKIIPTVQQAYTEEKVKFSVIVTDGRVPVATACPVTCETTQTSQKYVLHVEAGNLQTSLPEDISLYPGQEKSLTLTVIAGSNDAKIKVLAEIHDYDDHNRIVHKVGSAETQLIVHSRQTPPEFPNIEDRIELTIKKGWNLVSLPGELVRFDSEHNMYAFLWIDGKYESINDAKRMLGDDFNEYFKDNAFWVYSDQETTLSATYKESKGDIWLENGWNLVPYRNFFNGKTIIQLIAGCYVPIVHYGFGERTELIEACGLTSLYTWNADQQEWEELSAYHKFRNNIAFIAKAQSRQVIHSMEYEVQK